MIEKIQRNTNNMKKILKSEVLTGKKPGPIGPPGIPSFGGIWPKGLGAGPAFYILLIK